MRKIIDNSRSPKKKRPHIGHYGHLRKAEHDALVERAKTDPDKQPSDVLH